MNKLFLVILFILQIQLEIIQAKSFRNYKLVQVTPSDKVHLEFLKDLQDDLELDFWSENTNEKVDILIPPIKYHFLVEQFRLLNLDFQLLNTDIQRDIDDERARLINNRKIKRNEFNYEEFNTIEDINAELDVLASRCADGLVCETHVIGQSVEGRNIKGISISKTSSNRLSIYIEATTHAREWLGTATIMKILKHLVDDYSTDAQVKQLVDKYDFLIYPIINQDGYNYTWIPDGNRLWRKNRSVNDIASCPGVDLNRNYDQMWSNAGTSNNQCSDIYRGPSPASEPETQAVQNNILARKGTILYFISLHTYGQYWLIPWGSYASNGRTCNYADDDAKMMVVANAAADAVEATYRTTWARGNSCATIYPASGITMDFAKDKGGITYTVTPELRGNSFIVSPTQITPSFNEIWNGITTAIKTIEQAQ